MYNRKSIRIILIILSLSIVAALFVAAGLVEKKRMYEEELGKKIAELGQDDFRFLVWNSSRDKREQCIEWWKNEGEDIYYLFLPSTTNDGLIYLFNLYENIWIDEIKVTVGEHVSLSVGRHTVALETGEEYAVEIMQSCNLASLFIETHEKNLDAIRESRENITAGTYLLLDEKGKVNCSGELEELRGRGNISYDGYRKKPFAFKTAEKISPLGMESNRKWTLLANASDETLMRNALVMEMGRGINMAFVPDMEYVDLYIDGEYQGNYQLAERIEIAKGRVDIRDLEEEMAIANPNVNFSLLETVTESNERFPSLKWADVQTKNVDISSGYLLELDMIYRYNEEVSGFTTSRNQPIVVQEPKYASEEQVMYLANRYQDFEDALSSENGYNEETGMYYYDYIDMESFAQKYLVEEMSKNLDASLTSFFLYVPEKDSRFYAGPLWDYDRTFGTPFIRDGIDLMDPEGFYASEDVYYEQADVNLLYLLCQQGQFQTEYKKIYFEQLRGVMIDIAEGYIDDTMNYLEDSAMMNAIRWDALEVGTNIKENRDIFREKNESIKTFIKARLEFLDEAWK